MERRGKAAGGGVGSVDRLVSVALFCSACQIKFPDVNEHYFHQMTVHASESEKDNNVSNPNPPRSFVPNSVIGPPDGSFQAYDSNMIQRKLSEHLKMSKQEVILPEIPRPLNPESSNFFGDFRGIPGCNNSCYLDVFFMILSFSSLFDGIYTQEALNSSVLLRLILFELVIPLRTRMSVSRDVIAMIRVLMSQKTQIVDYLGDIFDLEEFLMHLYKELNLSSICNFVNSSDIDGSIVCPLVLSIVSAGCKGVHASLQDSILYTLNEKETSIIHLPIAFFARVRPGNFDLHPLVLPQTSVFLETGTYIGGEHVVDNLIRAIYTLSAIVCIRLSHYVLFLRLKNGEWFFFDSMRRIDSGHHVPTSTHVPNFQKYLDSGCDESLLTLKSDARPGESRDSFHDRVTKHAYAYFFKATSEVLKESECVGLPADKPLLDARHMWEASQQTAKAQQPSQFSSQSSSAGGGAAAVSEHPAQSSRKPSTDRAAAVPAQPSPSCRQHSAMGGAAAVPHQTPPSFGHSQPPCPPRKPAHISSHIVEHDGSGISGLWSNFALYDAVIPFARKCESHISSFIVTDLTLVKDGLETACDGGVQVFGSFITSEEGTPEVRFRAVGFQFDDNSVINHEKPVASLSDPDEKKAFASRVNRKWRSSMITAITFARCN